MQSDVQLFHTCMNKEIIMGNYQNYTSLQLYK